MSDYLVGEIVTCTATFEAEGEIRDPTTVRFLIEDPTHTITEVAEDDAVHVDDGVYAIDVELTRKGYWSVRVEGTGAVAAPAEITLHAVTALRL